MPKPDGIWRTLRIAIILLVANILLVTNFYIYSMYINNQSMDLSLSAQSLESTPTHKTNSAKVVDYSVSIKQALQYDLPEGYQASVKTVTWPLNEQALKSRTSECKTEMDANQITSTSDSYKDVKGVEYTFSKEGVDGKYVVTVFPNKRFSSLEDAQKILSVCPGGQLSPKALSPSGIIFTDSCGSGVSGKDCEQIRTTIEPTLSIQ